MLQSLFVCILATAQLSAVETTDVALNPIRKVVNLLQSMQKKVQQEGEAEEKLYDKFMCFCKTGGGELTGSISAAEDKIPSVGSSIEAAEASLTQAKDNLKQAQTDRSAAKAAMASATGLREKEAANHAAYKADADTNVAAIAKAVSALNSGMAGGFLQTDAAAVLRRAVEKAGLLDADEQELTAFLTQGSSYAPSSGEITGILKNMGDTMAANLADAVAAEKKSINLFEALIAAKSKEVAATTATVEAKTAQIGELGVSIVQMKEDLSDTQASLAEDQKFMAELKTSCSTKTAEWEERSKTRAEELVALADTIKVLNDDDALELFKKTLPGSSASFVQESVTTKAVRAQALATIRAARNVADASSKPGLEMLALVLSGKKAASAGGFDKVIVMIDNMVAVLGKEQKDDENKKEYCEMQHDLSDDKKKALEREVNQEENSIATAQEELATLTEDIAALTAGIKALDKSVAEATEQRQNENAEYKSFIASNKAAQEVLAFAKNRLNKFYNSKLYKPAPKVELSTEDRVYSNMGGVVTTAAPGGIADTGVTVFAQVSAHKHGKAAPAPPPETWGAYASKGQQSTGVIAMIDLLVKDLAKDMTEAATQEKDDQADYVQMMRDAAGKRTTDSEALTSKSASKADMEGELQDHAEHKAAAGKELMATMKYIQALHSECDWLVQYFDVRKEARSGEIDSLKNAKAVLSGAEYSLIQNRRSGFLAQ